MTEPEPPEHRWHVIDELDEWLRVPMLLLSLVWVGVVAYELILGQSRLLEVVGAVIWAVFILEFAVRLFIAPEKKRFLASNWLTVIALVVPAFRLLRALSVLRAARALRAFRLVRIVGSTNRSMRALRAALKRRSFGYVTVLTLLIALVGAAGMWSFERSEAVAGGFSSYWDALWWTAMLLTTIGSQYWPVTTEGRVLTLFLSIYGLGVLGYVTATLASFFIGRDAEEPSAPVAGAAELARLREEIRLLREAFTRSPPAVPAAGARE